LEGQIIYTFFIQIVTAVLRPSFSKVTCQHPSRQQGYIAAATVLHPNYAILLLITL